MATKMWVFTVSQFLTDGDFFHQGRDTEKIMTIRWKALEEHFLNVPLVF
jgi:hypothetical protein